MKTIEEMMTNKFKELLNNLKKQNHNKVVHSLNQMKNIYMNHADLKRSNKEKFLEKHEENKNQIVELKKPTKNVNY